MPLSPPAGSHRRRPPRRRDSRPTTLPIGEDEELEYAGGATGAGLDVRIRFNPALPLVRLVGELDLYSAKVLADAVEAVATTASGAPLVLLDLAGLTFCDLAGLRAVEACALNLESLGKQLVLYRPSREVSRLIALSGVASGLDCR